MKLLSHLSRSVVVIDYMPRFKIFRILLIQDKPQVSKIDTKMYLSRNSMLMHTEHCWKLVLTKYKEARSFTS